MIRRTIREYRKAIPKLRQLSARAWIDLLQAQLALIAAQARVLFIPKGSLASLSERSVQGEDRSKLPRARELALAISRAATFGVFRPACLPRSMALHALMERKGIHDGVIRIGVAVQGEKLHAHAWVEYAGEVLGDDPARVSDFAMLPGISVLHAD